MKEGKSLFKGIPGFVLLDPIAILSRSSDILLFHDFLLSAFRSLPPLILSLEYLHQEVFLFFVYSTLHILHTPFLMECVIVCLHVGW